MTIGEIIVLLAVGTLAGRTAATVLGGRGSVIRDTLVGILGAVVGGFIFNALNIELPADLEASVSLADVIVAFCGAMVVLLLARRL